MVEPPPTSGPPRRAGAIARQPWLLIALAGAGLAIGAWLGAQYVFLATGPWSGFFPPYIGVGLASIGLIGGAGLIGLLLLVPRATRKGAQGLLVIAIAAALGWGLGWSFGSRWQPGVQTPGTIELRLPDHGAVLSGAATCSTVDNGDEIDSIVVDRLGSIGIDTISVRVHPRVGVTSIQILVNELAGYAGTMVVSDANPDRSTGTGSFDRLEGAEALLGGTGGTPSVSGSIAWICGSTTGTGPSGAPTERLQGLFRLGGLVTFDPCPNDGPCDRLGRAEGVCSPAFDLRTGAIETVVPWVDGGRARLVLVPGRDEATLTVHVDGGAQPETVTARSRLFERTSPNAAGGALVLDRTLRAVFQLGAGPLGVEVEWSCPDGIELGG